MNTALWIVQIVAALIYVASGVMKTFLFDRVSHDVPSFGALPRAVWAALGIVELLCVVGLVVPGVLGRSPSWTVLAASVLSLESLVFVGVHVRYREPAAIVMSLALGTATAFVAYGRAEFVAH